MVCLCRCRMSMWIIPHRRKISDLRYLNEEIKVAVSVFSQKIIVILHSIIKTVFLGHT